MSHRRTSLRPLSSFGPIGAEKRRGNGRVRALRSIVRDDARLLQALSRALITCRRGKPAACGCAGLRTGHILFAATSCGCAGPCEPATFYSRQPAAAAPVLRTGHILFVANTPWSPARASSRHRRRHRRSSRRQRGDTRVRRCDKADLPTAAARTAAAAAHAGVGARRRPRSRRPS